MKQQSLIVAGAIVLALVAAAYAWSKDKLNEYLPDKWKHKDHPKNGFRGAYGRTPGMSRCGIKGMNACNYA